MLFMTGPPPAIGGAGRSRRTWAARGRVPAGEPIPHPVEAEAAVGAHARDRVEVEDVGDHLVARAGLVADVAFGVHDHAAPQRHRRRGVDADDVDLVGDGVGAGQHELGVAVARGRQRGLQHHLRAGPRQRAEDLGEGAVVADGQADAADAGDVEGREAGAGHRLLVGLPREALAVIRHQLAVGREHDGGVVHAVGVALVQRAGHQPQLGPAGQRAEPLGQRPRDVDRDATGVAGGLVEHPADRGEVQLRREDELNVRERLAHDAGAVLEERDRGLGIVNHGLELEGTQGQHTQDGSHSLNDIQRTILDRRCESQADRLQAVARPRDQVQRRRELVSAASRLVARKGVASVRLRDIADEAGLTSGAVLYYYDGIDALFTAAYDRAVERFCREREEAVAGLRDAATRLATAVRMGIPSSPDDGDIRLLYELESVAFRDATCALVMTAYIERQVAMYTSIL